MKAHFIPAGNELLGFTEDVRIIKEVNFQKLGTLMKELRESSNIYLTQESEETITKFLNDNQIGE